MVGSTLVISPPSYTETPTIFDSALIPPPITPGKSNAVISLASLSGTTTVTVTSSEIPGFV